MRLTCIPHKATSNKKFQGIKCSSELGLGSADFLVPKNLIVTVLACDLSGMHVR